MAGQQAEAILTAVSVQTKLRKLCLTYIDLSVLEPGLLAKAVVRLEDVSLRATVLTSQQAEEILAAINKDTSLKKLDLRGIQSLTYIDPNLLASSITQLEEVNIGYLSITGPQLQALFTALKNPTKLKTVEIGWNVNLDSLKPLDRKEAVQRLSQVSITLADVKRESILEIESVSSLARAFHFGHFKITLEKDKFKLAQLDDQIMVINLPVQTTWLQAMLRLIW